MKIFVCSTSTSQTTGYARIGHILLNDLAARGHEVTHFAFQQYPQGVDRPLHPSINVIDVQAKAKQTFGYDIVAQEIAAIQPDVVLVYNDVVVTSQILNALRGLPKTYTFVSYLDLVYPYQDWKLIQYIQDNADHIFVFSDRWKSNLVTMSVPAKKIDVFPHGFDDTRFTPIPKDEARDRLRLQKDDFIVLNTNRNSYRKALDVTVRSFLTFWKAVGCPSHVKLMLNCRMDIAEGYDMLHVIRIECLKLSLDFERVIQHTILQLGTPGLVSDETLNLLYNACDVGINTCLGEGFGLCNVEHGGLGAPQIVSNVGGLADIFGGRCPTIDPLGHITLARCIDTHSGEIAIPDAAAFANALQTYYEDPQRMASDGSKVREHIRETYAWPSLLETFHARLLEVTAPTQVKPHAFPGVYWLNIPKRTDRRQHMLDQFKALGITDHTRIVPQADSHAHMSCMYGHYSAIYTAYQDTRDIAVFMEDDVLLDESSLAIPFEKFPKDWECVQLHYANPNFLKAVHEIRPDQTLLEGYSMSCAYYVMNRRGMRKFIELMGADGTMTVPIDLEKARAEELAYRYVKTYCLLYPLANTDESFGSDIPSSYPKEENARLIATLKKPTAWSPTLVRLEHDTHWHDSVEDSKKVLEAPKRYTRVWNDAFVYNTRHLANLDLCIEFGSFEGLTSNYMCDRLLSETGKVVCVDPHDTTYQDPGSGPDLFQHQYEKFVHNTKTHREAGRLDHIRQTTRDASDFLLKTYGLKADLVYVDGDHTADGTYHDAVLAFRLCKPGGHIIFDDYGWPHAVGLDGPKAGIELFLSEYGQDLRVLVKEYQVVVQKKM